MSENGSSTVCGAGLYVRCWGREANRLKGSEEWVGAEGVGRGVVCCCVMETGGRVKEGDAEGGEDDLVTDEDFTSSFVRLRGRLDTGWMLVGLGGTGGGGSEEDEEGEMSTSSKLRALGLTLVGLEGRPNTEKSSDSFPSWRSLWVPLLKKI